MTLLPSIRARLTTYIAHDDPRVAACNLIALIVASNQPFYPLYIWWAVSENITPSFYTFLSTPLFLAVPAVSRRCSWAGRALLPLAGMANTMLSAKVMGQQSGVEIFLLPCALIAVTFFRPTERVFGLALAGLALAIYLLPATVYDGPVHIYSAQEYESFSRLNAMSAASLIVFVGLIASGLMSSRKQA